MLAVLAVLAVVAAELLDQCSSNEMHVGHHAAARRKKKESCTACSSVLRKRLLLSCFGVFATHLLEQQQQMNKSNDAPFECRKIDARGRRWLSNTDA